MIKPWKATSTADSGGAWEQRRAPRHQLFADAEIFESHSGVHFKARTSDVSLFGCYMNTVNWLAPGSEIQLRIMHSNAAITIGGRVVRSGPAQGVGVEFTLVPSDQKAILKDWLAATA